ncbi:MAG: hypothetical protein ACYDA5_05510 [Vulcanimicrobiaceae bacterium]
MTRLIDVTGLVQICDVPAWDAPREQTAGTAILVLAGRSSGMDWPGMDGRPPQNLKRP